MCLFSCFLFVVRLCESYFACLFVCMLVFFLLSLFASSFPTCCLKGEAGYPQAEGALNKYSFFLFVYLFVVILSSCLLFLVCCCSFLFFFVCLLVCLFVSCFLAFASLVCRHTPSLVSGCVCEFPFCLFLL